MLGHAPRAASYNRQSTSRLFSYLGITLQHTGKLSSIYGLSLYGVPSFNRDLAVGRPMEEEKTFRMLQYWKYLYYMEDVINWGWNGMNMPADLQ